MAAVRTSAVKSQAASLLRPEPAESLLLNSAIPDARMFFRRRKLKTMWTPYVAFANRTSLTLVCQARCWRLRSGKP